MLVTDAPEHGMGELIPIYGFFDDYKDGGYDMIRKQFPDLFKPDDIDPVKINHQDNASKAKQVLNSAKQIF